MGGGRGGGGGGDGVGGGGGGGVGAKISELNISSFSNVARYFNTKVINKVVLPKIFTFACYQNCTFFVS